MRSTPRRSRPRARRRTDAGLTLLELLIAVTIIGSAGVMIVGSWGFNIRAANRNRSVAGAQTVLSSAGEQILAPSFAPPTCTGPVGVPTNLATILAAYRTQARTAILPSTGGWNASLIDVTAVDFWNGQDSGTIWGPSCFEANGLKMARATIVVRTPDGVSTTTTKVVKTDV